MGFLGEWVGLEPQVEAEQLEAPQILLEDEVLADTLF
jgi:hypothetical protein